MQGNTVRALTLEYHDVVSGEEFDDSGFPGAGPASYKLPLSRFERHLDAIATRAPHAPDRVLDWLGGTQSYRPLFLTFDDGGIGAYSCAAPALEARGWRGHFFVTGGRVGTRTFLSSAQLRALHERGHIIGTHSQTHPTRMGACSPEQIRNEWRESTAVLEDILGAMVTTASIPGGYFSRRVAELAADAGIRALFTSAPTTRCVNIEGCLVLGRYTIRRWSSARTAGALGAGAWVPRATQQAIYGGFTALRSILGDRYTQVRQQFWARNG